MKSITIPKICDFHIHLRQGEIMKEVTKLIKSGGTQVVYVMPNLDPPIKTAKQAIEYKKQLLEIDPNINYLMTLYLSSELTVDEVRLAHQLGIRGIKSYPKGVTTNSENGIESYEMYYTIFEEMERLGLVLNLHGEVPSNPELGICVLNAEEKFLMELEKIHYKFPKLKIVLEHLTCSKSIEIIKKLGNTVVATITAHHLFLIIDDWVSNSHNFCKPVAKYPHDRHALKQIIIEGNNKFFLGSDSAPHLRSKKECSNPPAGCFTSKHLILYLVHLFDLWGCLDKLENFICLNGARFYDLDVEKIKLNTITLYNSPFVVSNELSCLISGKEESIVPFMAGSKLNWSLTL